MLPDKSLSEEHVAVLINSPIARKMLAKMGMKAILVATALASAKRDRMYHSRRACCHNIEVGTRAVGFHCSLRRIVCGRLADDVAKSQSREVRAKDDEAIVIIAKQARVRNDRLPNILEGTLASIRPDPGNWVGVLALGSKLSKGGDSEFKVVDLFAVKLSKSNKLRDVVHYLRAWPSLKKLML